MSTFTCDSARRERTARPTPSVGAIREAAMGAAVLLLIMLGALGLRLILFLSLPPSIFH
jgi:hypothetical protein